MLTCVSGRVSGFPPGAEGVHVSARREDVYSSVTALRADGSFQFWRPVPGKYTLVATWRGPDGQDVQSGPVEIEVGAANVENVELIMLPPFDISGRMQIEQSVVVPKSESYSSPWSSEDEQDDAEVIDIRANDKLTKDLTLCPPQDQ